MRVAVLSDTHLHRGTDLAELLWGHLHGVDLILHAGDVVSADVIHELERIAPVRGVAGNMDPPEVRRLWPERQIVQVGAYRVGLIHGSGPPEGLARRAMGAFAREVVDAIVFGHSHQPLVEQRGGILLVNPGSPTDKRFAPYPSYAMMHAEEVLRAEIIRLPTI